ncbi:MAG: hypothetical protein M3Y53_05725 [Thermoproteota archaeon]|nr:hypothetical protein [Thermoproteota archaeon]
MRLPGWICVKCVKPVPRKWNAERHVYTQHPDESAQIVSMVDYLVGRLSGAYMASSRMRAPPPNRGQVEPSTNNFDFLQHVTPSHAAEYIKRPVAAVQTRKSATHLQDILHIFEPDEGYKQGESLTQSMTREFGLELARQLARNVLNQQRQQPVSATPEQLRLTPFSSNFLIPTVANLRTGEKVVLLSIELPGESAPPSEPTANDRIKIPYPRNPQTLITFHRSMEK